MCAPSHGRSRRLSCRPEGELRVPWVQNYDPLGSAIWSSLTAGLPILVLLGLLVWGISAPRAALAGLIAALAVAIGAFKMPAGDRLGRGRLWRLLWAAADRLDRAGRHFLLPPDRPHRAVRDRQTLGYLDFARPADAGAA